jgi:ribonucleotide reductase alpha subunit
MEKLYNNYDMHSNHTPIISKSVMDIASKYENEIDSIIDHRRDYKIDYFWFKTLERAYLFRINNHIVERIQHMWMRVSIGIHGDNFDLNSRNI